MLELSEEEAELRKNPCAPIERKPAGGRGFGERDGRGRGRGRGEGGRGGGRDWEERGRATRGARAGASGCRATCARSAPRQPRDSAGSDGVPRSPASGPGGGGLLPPGGGGLPAPAAAAGLLAPKPPVDWFYRDLEGQVQGPFEEKQIPEWFDAGFLPHDPAATDLAMRGSDMPADATRPLGR